MCRLFAAISDSPIDVAYSLLEASNPLVHQSAYHDSGWGLAYYLDGKPTTLRTPLQARSDPEFSDLGALRAHVFVAHLRRATVGGLSPENTHPFQRGQWSFCHNGTLDRHRRLLVEGVRPPAGETDSEVLFSYLMRDFDADRPVSSLGEAVRSVSEAVEFSALNFLLTDGHTLYAYRLGLFPVVWTRRLRADQAVTLVASEPLTDHEQWTELEQDTLLVCELERPDQPRLTSLIGIRAASIAFVKLEGGDALRGAARGAWAARRALDG